MKIDNLTSEQQWQLEEYIRCKNDLIYFIEHMALISAPGGDVHIKLYDLQKKYLNHLLNEKYSIILKSRQVGASTMSQLQCAWICTFFENAVIGVVSKSGSESTDFARKCMDIIDKLPDWVRPKFKKRTEQTFILENGCKFYAAAVNPSAPTNLLRGKSITLLILDEGAFIYGIDEGLAGCGPSVVKAQKTAKENGVPYGTTIISTPNRTTGIGKWYFNMWKEANNGEGIYKPFKMWWKDIPEFADDPTWYPTQCALLGNVKWRIAQELDMQFVASSESFFDSDTIQILNKIETKPVAITTINGYDLNHYQIPDKSKFYLIGIDTASAAGSDSSVIWVMDYETGDQVAELHAKLRVDDFCVIVEEVSKIFPENLIIPECNSYGNQVCEYLTRKGTFNLYQTKLSKGSSNSKSGPKFRYGLYTNPINRPLIIDAMYMMVTEHIEGIKSQATALELISLIDHGDGKIAADEGEHDDLVMAFAFCCYVKLYDPPKSLSSRFNTKEENENIADVVEWNNDENGLVSIAPAISQMYSDTENITDPVKKQQKINNAFRKFINTNLEKIMAQRADQPQNAQMGATINLINIMNGTCDTSWMR